MAKIVAMLAALLLSWYQYSPVHNAAVSPAEEIPFNELPRAVFLSDNYRVDSFISVAFKLQAAGKEKAVMMLRNFNKEKPAYGASVIVLCRMLFAAKPKGHFRGPKLGSPNCPADSSIEDWPLDPIDIVNGVPFLIIVYYSPSAFANPVTSGESADAYLEYCIKTCDWSPTEFKPLKVEHKQKALEILLASKKWKTPLTDGKKKFFAAQIE